MKRESIDKVTDLFEVHKVYLSRRFTVGDLAAAAGEDAVRMEADFERDFGYSFSEMTAIWRLCHARDLLMAGVPYAVIWKMSGFKSRKELERTMERLAY